MNFDDIYDRFLEAIPFKKKSSLDWLLPASIGIGLGAAIGVGIGLVLAPQSGELTRRQLLDGASQLKEKARLAAFRAKDQIAAKANGVSEQLGYDAEHGMR
ncbi:MAG TPA: YtxH domain-containing protein [Minicystis sp.]|nr:YtxH domain-containing protein [Minicystis sp.]